MFSGIPATSEVEAIASELAIAYLKARNEPVESPEAFTESYLDVSRRIYDMIRSNVYA